MSYSPKTKWYQRIKVPLAVVIAICVLPCVLTGLFYILRTSSGVMDWVQINISGPIRGFLGLLTSIYPFSVMEILIVAAVIWFFYYIIRTIMVTAHRRSKLKILGKRLLLVAVAAVYVWSAFCWLWSGGYHAPGFAEKNGFKGGGVSTDDLITVTRYFADKASEFSLLVERDEDGVYIEDQRKMMDVSVDVYRNISYEFPSLGGRLYRPKSMLFSWLMSRTGYTGVYFALTGEANVNTNPPGFLLPATLAHEHAHQLGIFAEDEANFTGIIACVTSGVPVFQYAGYLRGFLYLMSAVSAADPDAWNEIRATISDEVVLDWQSNFDFWESQKTVDTGIGFLDSILTSVTVTMSDAVDSIYDGYLKSNNQDLGLRSYGACVDLLVEYYSGIF